MKHFIRIIIVMLSISVTYGQTSELGVFVGSSYYVGELTNSYFSNPKSAGGVIYRYNISPRWAFKGTALFGSLEASDKETNSNNPRNLSFRSPLSELSLQMEFHFFRLYNETEKNPFTPYIFGGISAFSFNPQAKYDDNWYDLQPMGTEGQGIDKYPEPYSLTSISIPFGLGLKINFLKRFTFGAEWGLRKTFTDYIDDISGVYVDKTVLQYNNPEIISLLADRSEIAHKPGSARGLSTNNDWYGFLGFWLTFKLTNDDNGCSSYSTRKIRKKVLNR